MNDAADEALAALQPGDKVLGEFQQAAPEGAEALNARDDMFANAGASRADQAAAPVAQAPPMDFTMEAPQQAQQAAYVPPVLNPVPQITPQPQAPPGMVPNPHFAPQPQAPPGMVPNPHYAPQPQPTMAPGALPFQQTQAVQPPGTMQYQQQHRHFQEQPVVHLDKAGKCRYACDIMGQLFVMLRDKGVTPGAYMMARVNDYLASEGYSRLT